MSTYYSKSTGGFYDAAIHHAMPSDAVSISDEVRSALFAAQAAGMVITADSHGNPTAVTATSLLTLDQVKAAQIAALNLACQTEITGGYTSAALGSVHTYGSQDHDQRNLTDAMNASLAPGLASDWKTKIWCAVGSAWAITDHTAAQIQQAHSDWIAFRVARQVKLAGLTLQVNSAATVDSIQAIVWNS